MGGWVGRRAQAAIPPFPSPPPQLRNSKPWRGRHRPKPAGTSHTGVLPSAEASGIFEFNGSSAALHLRPINPHTETPQRTGPTSMRCDATNATASLRSCFLLGYCSRLAQNVLGENDIGRSSVYQGKQQEQAYLDQRRAEWAWRGLPCASMWGRWGGGVGGGGGDVIDVEGEDVDAPRGPKRKAPPPPDIAAPSQGPPYRHPHRVQCGQSDVAAWTSLAPWTYAPKTGTIGFLDIHGHRQDGPLAGPSFRLPKNIHRPLVRSDLRRADE